MPSCSMPRRSRSGRNTSVPSSRITSSPSRPSSPWDDPVGAHARGPPRRPTAMPGVRDAARERIGRQHPHGRAGRSRGPSAPSSLARTAALAEGLEGRETLGWSPGTPPRSPHRRGRGPGSCGWSHLMKRRRREKGDQGGGEERSRATARSIQATKAKIKHRRDGGHEELGQVLAEVNLQVLDGVHQGDHQVARAGQPQVGRPQGDDLVVKGLAAGCSCTLAAVLVGRHDAGVLQDPAQQDHRGDADAGVAEGPRCGAPSENHGRAASRSARGARCPGRRRARPRSTAAARCARARRCRETAIAPRIEIHAPDPPAPTLRSNRTPVKIGSNENVVSRP